MPISPTNRSKSVIVPNNDNKTGIVLWGDNDFTWGGIDVTWGVNYNVTNRSKSTSATTTIAAGSPIGLLLALTYASTVVIGGGWINRNKN